jgi:outer membrane protein
LRAQATRQRLIDLRNQISRDVRTSWLAASTAFDRVSVTEQLPAQANQALDLAQTRYKLGLSSIVELSQAQLQQTQGSEARRPDINTGWPCRFCAIRLRDCKSGCSVR